MSKRLKSSIAKGAVAMAVGFATVTGATHLLGSGNTDNNAAIAQMTTVPAALTAQLPAQALTPGRTLPAAPATPASSTAPEDCTARFDADLMQGAMVRLTLDAPCDPDTPVQIAHEGLIFDMATDANGALSVEVPALAPVALFQADLAGLPLRTIAAIPDFESYTRVALQWQGQTGLQIHALEFGAGHGGAGHVWAAAPGSSERAVRARGGFLTRLGDPMVGQGHSAEIYVFPAGTIQRNGTVRLSVEAEVSALTCGKSVSGQALQPDADGKMHSTALSLEIPDCDGIGDILVLKNLLRDMKIASN